MIHEVLTVGSFACNCHILADETSKEAVIVDPGDDPEGILEVVRDLGVTVKTILHTHCHLDHIMGSRRVKEETGARLLIHEGDRVLYENLKEQCATTLRLFGVGMREPAEPLPVDGVVKHGDRFSFGRHEIRVLHTPGHTPGSCSFHLQDLKQSLLFSGDTLFRGSVGRTDLMGGDMDQEVRSIREQLFTLEGDTVVFPGHGPSTRIAVEKKSNPFVGDEA